MGAEALLAAGRAFSAGVQVVPASALDRHNIRAEWALAIVVDGPLPWDALERRYPAGHPVRLILSDGAERATTLREARGETAALILLGPLGRDDLADPASVTRIMERLRAPGGCPWDREQTHASLRPYLMEESFEALDAIDDGDLDRLADELGDLLLQVVFHAQLGHEEGAFDLGEVARRLSAKLLRRHPHVFGDEPYAGSEHLARWEQLKRGEAEEPASLVAGVPRSAPALFVADRLVERAARVHVRVPHDGASDIGERLFALVAEARDAGIDAEQALRAVNRRFIARFERLEAHARLGGRELETLTEGEVADLWDQAR